MKQIVIATKKVKDFDYLELAIKEFINDVEQSPKGKFASKYAVDTQLIREYNPDFFEHKLTITAYFDDLKLTEFYLRFDNYFN